MMESEKNMRVSLKAITMSSAILWALAMLLVGLIHMAAHSYGGEFLRLMSSVYPGADTAPTIGRVLLGTVYGFIDGAVAGCLFGLLYDFFVGRTTAVSR
jgi:ABC-type phosphate transport system permease subunit